jgi:hypothetical protein
MRIGAFEISLVGAGAELVGHLAMVVGRLRVWASWDTNHRSG